MELFDKIKQKKTSPKTVVIGLDGVPYSELLTRLIEAGELENMASLFRQGYLGRTEVCIPEISSVSWTSFMTGAQSGEHGIYGFMDLKPGTYEMYFPNFLNLKKKTLFDELGAMGKRSVVINLPSTYPAREIPGVLVSGFVAIDIKKAVYPYSLLPELQGMGYAIDINVRRGREDHDYLLRDLETTLTSRQNLADLLWERENWDLFMVVITGTDRINHFLWDAYADFGHARHADFIEYYKKVDKFVGLFYKKYCDLPGSHEGTNHFIMLSDHGFTGIRSEVYLNRWLEENGFLSFNKNPQRSLKDVTPESKAFALDPSRIYIHAKERYPKGSVATDDIEKIKNEIRSGLQELTFEDGSPVLRKILDRNEVFHGPFTQQGPDLVLLSHHGFDLKGRINSKSTFGLSGLTGMHTQDDAFFFSDKGKKVDTIFELKELILKDYREQQ
jgi:predicted AlkP superfamily phosphohydrolase/phosphomutase